jgi:hypothetical protein
MIRRLAGVAGWLMAMQAVLAALYWALLATPESNAWMLALSALLVVALLVVAGVALDGAGRLWVGRSPWPRRAGEVLAPARRLLPALVVVALVAWAAGVLNASIDASRGPVTAWLIARTGWANSGVLFTSAQWLLAFVTWVVGPALALALFAALTRGAAGVVGRTVGHGLSWPALVAGSVGAAAIGWGWPWLVAWRPALPPTWVQLAVAGAKVAIGFAAVAVVLAAMVRLTAGERAPLPPPASPRA